MQCQSFTLRVAEGRAEGLERLNRFLGQVVPIQVSSSLVQADPPFWSVLVFFEGQAPAVEEEGRKLKDVTPSSAPAAPDSPALEALRQWRSQKARAEGVPPYVVARNADLEALAAAKPASPAELEAVPGFGKARREKYGLEVLEVLKGVRVRPK